MRYQNSFLPAMIFLILISHLCCSLRNDRQKQKLAPEETPIAYEIHHAPPSFNGGLQIANLPNKFYALVQANLPDTMQLDTIIMFLETIPANFNQDELNSIQILIENLHVTYFGSLDEHALLRTQVEDAISKNQLSNEYLIHALPSLINFHTKHLELTKTIHYYGLLMNHYPEHKHFEFATLIPCAKEVLQIKDSIELLDLPDDVYLYQIALLKLHLADCGWLRAEHLNYAYVHETMHELLEKFPASNFADNAHFFTISNVGCCGDTYSIPEGLSIYRDFIETYPDSELQYAARMSIVNLYFNEWQNSAEPYLLDSAYQELISIPENFIDDTVMHAHVLKNITDQKEF